jgi:hypothetical protein
MGDTVEYAAAQRKGLIGQQGMVALLFLANGGGGMTPESEAELKANIKLLLELVREQQASLRDHQASFREQNSRLNQMSEDIAWIKAHIANMPQPPEFYELRGRVEEISRRLPTAIAYAPPQPAGRRDPAE